MIDAINVVRVFASLAVTIYHFFPNKLQVGYVGVHIFLAISGYLMSKKLDENKLSFAGFVQNRFWRFYPSLIIVIMVVSVIVVAIGRQLSEQIYSEIIYAGTFLSSIYYNHIGGYFDAGIYSKYFLNYWSISIEMQILMLWYFVRKKMPLYYILVATSFLAFIMNDLRSQYFLIFDKFWIFCLGDIFWRNLSVRRVKGGNAALIILILTTVKILGSEKINIVIAVIVTLLMCSSGYRYWFMSGHVKNIINYASKISYEIYLLHWPILIILFSYAYKFPTPGQRLIGIAVVIIISGLIQYTSTKIIVAKKETLIYIAIILIGVFGMNEFIKTSSAAQDLIFDRNIIGNGRICKEEELYCIYNGNNIDGVTDIIIGDSHAVALYSGLDNNRRENTLLLSKSACPTVTNVDVRVANNANCINSIDKILKILENYQEGNEKTVHILNYGFYYEDTDYSYDHVNYGGGPKETSINESKKKEEKKKILFNGYAETINKLKSMGFTVKLIIDNPELKYNPAKCIPNIFQSEVECQIERSDKRYREYLDFMSNVQIETRTEVENYFSEKNEINEVYSKHHDMLYYRDSHHLSSRGSKIIFKEF